MEILTAEKKEYGIEPQSPYNCLMQFQEPLLSPHLDGLSARQG